jgi:hypothetical protein
MDLLKTRQAGLSSSLSSISSASTALPSSTSSSYGYHSGPAEPSNCKNCVSEKLPPINEFSLCMCQRSSTPNDFVEFLASFSDPGRIFCSKLNGYLSQILDSENREKDTNVRQLQMALKAQEKTIQVLNTFETG